MTEDLGPAKTFFAYMDAVMASGLTPSQRLVLLVQAKHADAWDGDLTNSFPSQETMARETGLSESTVKRERRKLVESGWLVQTHSGRGGSSRLANAYDLAVPDGASSKGHGDPLQKVMVHGQRVMVTPPKGHGDLTSTPSSTPPSAAVSTPSHTRLINESKEGTKEGSGDAYWVGYSKKHRDGYFFRAEGASEPKGSHVLVTLTGREVQNVFGSGLDYPQKRAAMLDHARDAGLRQPSGPAAHSRLLTRAERDRLYGLPPGSGFTVERREPSKAPGHREESDAGFMRRMARSYR